MSRFKLEKETIEDWEILNKAIVSSVSEDNFRRYYVNGKLSFLETQVGKRTWELLDFVKFDDNAKALKNIKYKDDDGFFVGSRLEGKTLAAIAALVENDLENEGFYTQLVDDVGSTSKKIHKYRGVKYFLDDFIEGIKYLRDALLFDAETKIADDAAKTGGGDLVRPGEDKKLSEDEYKLDLSEEAKEQLEKDSLAGAFEDLKGGDLTEVVSQLGDQSLAASYEGLKRIDTDPKAKTATAFILPKQSKAGENYLTQKPSGYSGSGFLYLKSLVDLNKPVYSGNNTLLGAANPLTNEAIDVKTGVPVERKLEEAVYKLARALKVTTAVDDVGLLGGNYDALWADVTKLRAFAAYGIDLSKNFAMNVALKDIIVRLAKAAEAFDLSQTDEKAQTAFTGEVAKVLKDALAKPGFINFLLYSAGKKIGDFFDLSKITDGDVKKLSSATKLGGSDKDANTRKIEIDKTTNVQVPLDEVYKGFLEAIFYFRDACLEILQNFSKTDTFKGKVLDNMKTYFFNKDGNQATVIEWLKNEVKLDKFESLLSTLFPTASDTPKRPDLYDNDLDSTNAVNVNLKSKKSDGFFDDALFWPYAWGVYSSNKGTSTYFGISKREKLGPTVANLGFEENLPVPYLNEAIDKDVFFQAMDWLAGNSRLSEGGTIKTTQQLVDIFGKNKDETIELPVKAGRGVEKDTPITVEDYYKGTKDSSFGKGKLGLNGKDYSFDAITEAIAKRETEAAKRLERDSKVAFDNHLMRAKGRKRDQDHNSVLSEAEKSQILAESKAIDDELNRLNGLVQGVAWNNKILEQRLAEETYNNDWVAADMMGRLGQLSEFERLKNSNIQKTRDVLDTEDFERRTDDILKEPDIVDDIISGPTGKSDFKAPKPKSVLDDMLGELI